MVGPQIRLIGPEYDGAEKQLGTLAEKLPQVVKYLINKRPEVTTPLEPTDIEIAPVVIEDDRFFVIRAWHETGSAEGKIGVLQPFEGVFDVAKDDTDAYLHHREEDETNFKLTTVETLILNGLGKIAAELDMLSSPMGQENPGSLT